LRPNEIPFEFEKTIFVRLFEVVPALTLIEAAVGGATDAVITEPFSPKLTLFKLLNVTALRLFEVVPALTLIFVRLVATDAVTVLAFKPNETPFELLNVNADARFDVVPALMLMLACVLATVALAVMVEPLSPKLTLFELLNVTAVRLFEVVPPEMFIPVMSVPLPLARPRVWLPPLLHTIARAPPLLLIPSVTVEARESPIDRAGPK
jgi:hypothetical protein